jgi:sugar/nucleoside kinase (ribokinase family)
MTRTDRGEPSSPIDYLVIGHVAKDLTPAGPRLGGTVSYSGLTAHALGCRTGLVTACDTDLDLSPLAGLACRRVASAVSTTFENIYSAHGRQQYLRAQATALPVSAVPAAWLSAAIIHFGPIAHEIAAEMVPALAAAAPGCLIGLTPQGWLRQWNEAGAVRPAAWPEGLNIFPSVQAVVLSIEDVQGDWQLVNQWAAAAPTLVITEGAQGCAVFVRGQSPQTFAPPSEVEVDPTGAGDIFAAAFFIRLRETRNPYDAAKFANRVAAQSVTRLGLAGVPTAAEVAALRQDYPAEAAAA